MNSSDELFSIENGLRMTRCPCPPILDLVFPDFQIPYSTGVTRLSTYPQSVRWKTEMPVQFQDRGAYKSYTGKMNFQHEISNNRPKKEPQKGRRKSKESVSKKSTEKTDSTDSGKQKRIKTVYDKQKQIKKIFQKQIKTTPRKYDKKIEVCEAEDIPGIEEFLALDVQVPGSIASSMTKFVRTPRKKSPQKDPQDSFQLLLEKLLSTVQEKIHPKTQKRKYKKRNKPANEEVRRSLFGHDEDDLSDESEKADLSRIPLNVLDEYEKRDDLTPRMASMLRHQRLRHIRALRMAHVTKPKEIRGRGSNITASCSNGGRCSNKWQQIQKYALDQQVVQKLRENEQTQKLIKVLSSAPQRTLRSTETDFNDYEDVMNVTGSVFLHPNSSKESLSPIISEVKEEVTTPEGYILDEDNLICPDIEPSLLQSTLFEHILT